MGRRRYQRPSVMKTKAARPSWYFRARVEVFVGAGQLDRREKTYHLGWCEDMGKREAERKRDAILETINNKPLFVQSQIQFDSVLKAYERTFLPTLKPNSRTQYASKINRYIRPEFGHLQLHQVNAEAVQNWINRMVAEDLSRATIQNTKAIMSSVMRQAAAWEMTQQRNPTDFVRVGECKSKRKIDTRALTVDEVRRLLAVCDLEPEAGGCGRPSVNRLGDMVRIGVFCDLRAGEILALTWGAYRPPAFVIEVSRSQHGGETVRPKSTAGTRIVPVGPIVLHRPADARDAERIFDCEYRAAHRALTDAAKIAGIEFDGFGWHTLRRTYATLRKRSAASGSLREVMGHATEEMSAKYVRESFADDVAAVEKMSAMVIGDVSNGHKN